MNDTNTCENCHYFEDTGKPFCSRWRFYISSSGKCSYFDRWTTDRLESENKMAERKKNVNYREKT